MCIYEKAQDYFFILNKKVFKIRINLFKQLVLK